jgi:N-acetyl-anhydromuramyl-L-alanine amidase AmpD
VTFIQAANYTKGPRSKGKIRLIVIHDMEAPEKGTTAESVAQYFARQRKGPNGSSAHYCVDNNSVVQCVKDSDIAWHAPYVNHDSIGIEHAGYAHQNRHQWVDQFSKMMLARSAKLAARKSIEYGIPVKRLTVKQLKAGKAGFIGHVDASAAYTPGGHGDPGRSFPWDIYLDMVRAEVSALKGNKWTKKRIAAAATAAGVSLSVFAGVSQTNNPPAPVPVVQPTRTAAPKPKPAPTKKPAPAPKPKPKPKATYTLHRVLAQGSQGADVRRLQKVLGVHVDGKFGPRTRTAVLRYQWRKNLRVVDGVVGPATAKKLGWKFSR